jgi:hypothetical protein
MVDGRAIGRRSAAAEGLADRCRFVLASADSLADIADASVDAVTTRSVLIYVKGKAEALRGTRLSSCRQEVKRRELQPLVMVARRALPRGNGGATHKLPAASIVIDCSRCGCLSILVICSSCGRIANAATGTSTRHPRTYLFARTSAPGAATARRTSCTGSVRTAAVSSSGAPSARPTCLPSTSHRPSGSSGQDALRHPPTDPPTGRAAWRPASWPATAGNDHRGPDG